MSVGLSEIFLIVLIAFLVIKPERLPEVASALGKSFASVRTLLARFKKNV